MMVTTKQALETLMIAPGKLMWRLSCNLSGNFYGIQKNLANHWLFFSWLLVQLVLMTVATAFFLGSLAQNFALPITTFLGLLGVWLATFFLDRCLSSGSWAPGADQVTGGPRFSCSLHHLMVIPYQNQWFIIIFSMKTDVFEGIPYFQTNQFQVVG
jgi:hypothetical protein